MAHGLQTIDGLLAKAVPGNQDKLYLCRCMGLTGFFHDPSIPEEQGIEVLRRALELGVTVSNEALQACVSTYMSRCSSALRRALELGVTVSSEALHACIFVYMSY